ncbi:potassium voltage-gated channel protein Shaw-like [Ylistrum balloti]|uniref:potassium voltage-gated channel protein Shaw-like n=1 Tax=Ylistrum balloti TaxID=509963 RepID=UPI002905B361|nr:potassium voltage-gated channel protein Shaw-like [Ylistrum balloti]
MGCNKNECILQLGSDQFVVTKEAALRAFGSKIEAFLDTSSEPDMFTKYIIRRPRASTLALIEYCYTGQLHIPQSVCKGEFLTELQFWGLRYKLLETCCYQKLCIFLNNQQMLKGFQEMYTRQENSSTDRKQYRSVKERIWGIVNNDRKSRLSKVYFRVSTTFVVLMIAVLAITSMNDVSKLTQRNISTQLEDMNSTITSDSLRSISSTVDEDNSKTPSF